MRIRIFTAPKSTRQLLKQERQAKWRLAYLLGLMSAEVKAEYWNERRRLLRTDGLPPHHTEYHVPNQGCLLCEIEIAENLLLEAV